MKALALSLLLTAVICLPAAARADGTHVPTNTPPERLNAFCPQIATPTGKSPTQIQCAVHDRNTDQYLPVLCCAPNFVIERSVCDSLAYEWFTLTYTSPRSDFARQEIEIARARFQNLAGTACTLSPSAVVMAAAQSVAAAAASTTVTEAPLSGEPPPSPPPSFTPVARKKQAGEACLADIECESNFCKLGVRGGVCQ